VRFIHPAQHKGAVGMDPKTGELYDAYHRSCFCSKECFSKSLRFVAQLLPEPVHMRPPKCVGVGERQALIIVHCAHPTAAQGRA